MDYPAKIIADASALSACPLFAVDRFQWTCLQHPRTEGRLAYLEGEGFLLHMECFETNPKRVYDAPQSPVCNDSAMEAFFAFTPSQPTADSMYLNLEFNANGAMHAKYGAGRKNRTPLSPAEYAACNCCAQILPDRWTVDLRVPLPLITKLCGISSFCAGDSIYCNFYKISESPEIEHYAAYRPLRSDTPNFHMPACFGKAVLV